MDFKKLKSLEFAENKIIHIYRKAIGLWKYYCLSCINEKENAVKNILTFDSLSVILSSPLRHRSFWKNIKRNNELKRLNPQRRSPILSLTFNMVLYPEEHIRY